MFVEPMLSKTSDATIEAFKNILDRTPLRPMRVQSDQGKEFNSAKFKKFMKANDIIYNHTNNPDTKASCCERSIRTLKGHIFKYMTHNDTDTFIDRLDDFVSAYNGAYHRTIKMAPNEVNDENVLQVYDNIHSSQRRAYRKRRPKKGKYKVGDYVRIIKEKNVFAKGYLKNFTGEVFKIKVVVPRTPVLYRLVDLADEDITGTFYEPEIQKIIFDETAAKSVSKIIKQRVQGKNLQYYVSWQNFSPAFNSWINASEITSK